jgi:hypothetical protein
MRNTDSIPVDDSFRLAHFEWRMDCIFEKKAGAGRISVSLTQNPFLRKGAAGCRPSRQIPKDRRLPAAVGGP